MLITGNTPPDFWAQGNPRELACPNPQREMERYA